VNLIEEIKGGSCFQEESERPIEPELGEGPKKLGEDEPGRVNYQESQIKERKKGEEE